MSNIFLLLEDGADLKGFPNFFFFFFVFWALDCFVTGLTYFSFLFAKIEALPRLSISPLILIALTFNDVSSLKGPFFSDQAV